MYIRNTILKHHRQQLYSALMLCWECTVFNLMHTYECVHGYTHAHTHTHTHTYTHTNTEKAHRCIQEGAVHDMHASKTNAQVRTY